MLEAHGVVAIPTETFYGLAASAFDARACARVFEIKGRLVERNQGWEVTRLGRAHVHLLVTPRGDGQILFGVSHDRVLDREIPISQEG